MKETNYEILQATTSCVLVGEFNPAMFHPHWLCGIGALTATELDHLLQAAKENRAGNAVIVTQPIAQIQWSSRSLQVTHERLIVTSSDSAKVRDVVEIVLTQLATTPMRALGINVERHFKTANVNAWHGLGDTLAPKAPWDFFVGEVTNSASRGGLKSMTMRRFRAVPPRGERDPKFPGYMDLEIGALLDPPIERGVYAKTNDHYDVPGEERERTGYAARSLLVSRWDLSVQGSEAAIGGVMQLARKLEA